MAYPDTLLVTTTQVGHTGSDDVFVSGGALEAYNGGCDFQDAPEDARRDADGAPAYRREAVVFLEEESGAQHIRVEDDALVTLGSDGTVVTGKVVAIRKLDGVVRLSELTWPTGEG